MVNPSAAIMSINAASEALKQGHNVTYFAAGDGVRILLNDVIKNLHTVPAHGGGFGKISQMAENLFFDFSNFRFNGAMEIGNSGSFSPMIRHGEYDSGEFLSPIENSLENLSLEIVLLARGLSSIGYRWKHFA